MEGGNLWNNSFLLVFLLLAMAVANTVNGHRTRVEFYSNSCPRAECIVKSTVESYVKSDPTLAAGLLRLHFHDCFVRGCDASVLIDGYGTERRAPPNVNLRGFEVIDGAKAQIEAVCPGVVSCSDILALAARDAVVMSGGLSWQVPTGRRDGRVSIGSETSALPAPNDTIAIQKHKFSVLGLNIRDLVILAGGHTIGRTACQFFADRIYGSNGTDPSIKPSFVPTLRQICSQNEPTKRVALDTGSQFKFDTSYFVNLKKGHGILRSDQVLWTDASTRKIVKKYLATNRFNVRFGKSMVKMGNIGVMTGAKGEIRRTCSAVNYLYSLVFFFLALAIVNTVRGQGTRVGFYSSACPRAESIVRSTVQSHVRSDPTLAAGLLRMHFHDCFVQGCDGSVLISGAGTERTAIANLGLRGYEVVDDAKTQLEAACPGVVSCADILALSARDSVVLSGGLSWQVPTGRRDGRISQASDVNNLPSPFDSVDVQKQKFSAKGLNTQDLVTLVGLLGLTFNVEFGKSMVKMSNIELKTGTAGEIRKICSAIN
ncbi:Cationic peroxidase 2 [Spatholobus suberectus]|nr:Cationic peroxidase 2 [Spatholobus suberectus]